MSVQVIKTDYLKGKFLDVVDEENPSRFLVQLEENHGVTVVHVYENQNQVLCVKQGMVLQNRFKCDFAGKILKITESISEDKVYKVCGSDLRLMCDENNYMIRSGTHCSKIDVKNEGANLICTFDGNGGNQYLIIIALLLCSMI